MKIKLNDVLKNYKNEPAKSRVLKESVQEFFQDCKNNLEEFKDQYEPVREKIQNQIKEKLKPFIFLEHLEILLNKSADKENQQITNRDLLRFALTQEVAKDLNESMMKGKLLNQINKSKYLELKKDSEKKYICENLLKVNGIEIEPLTTFIYSIQETIGD